jgi:hypothetical protein
MRRLPKTLFSFIVGQGVFWKLGYDQIGLFMKPKVQLGKGQQIADYIARRLPPDEKVAWTLKVVEVLTDLGKAPLEGALYKKHGYAPDAVATLATQPLWSVLEAIEKATGAALHPERVNTPEQIRVSIGCIYGSLFRYAQVAALWAIGPQLYKAIGQPLESGFSNRTRSR